MVVKQADENAEKGVGLVLALLILALLSMLVAAMLTAVTVEGWIGDNYRTETQLVYLTEAGIEEGREVLRSSSIDPSSSPFIDDRLLLDLSGREAGRYSLTLVRSDPLTLRSEGALANARKTIEARLRKSGFPVLPDAILLNEDLPLPAGLDPQLETTGGLEALAEGILRHATDIYNPAVGEATHLGALGSASDYRVVVVNGDSALVNATGYGLLLVRGEMTVSGTFAWNGMVVVLGQAVLRASGATTGAISGGLLLARTRADDRVSSNPLGTMLPLRGAVTLDLPAGSVTVSRSEAEMKLANQRFPYVVTGYREY